MNMIKIPAGVIAAVLITQGTATAENADINVTGEITPAGCKLEFEHDAPEWDFGDINGDELLRNQLNWLDDSGRLGFSIICDSPAKVALTARSGRGNSAVNEDGSLSGVATVQYKGKTVHAYGLGLDNEKGIGGYTLTLDDEYSLDPGDDKLKYYSDYLVSDGSVSAWQKHSEYPSIIMPGQQRYITWGINDNTPSTISILHDAITIIPYINKTSELDLSKPIKLDGLVSLEVVYL